MKTNYREQITSDYRGYVKSYQLPPFGGILVVICLWVILAIALVALLQAGSSFDKSSSLIGYILKDARIGYALKSALVQASLSSLCSVMIAIPLSIVMARRYHLIGMSLLRAMTGLAFVIPTTVAASGLLAVWGRQGIVNNVLDVLPFSSFELPSFFGLKAVILAHVFFNAPLMIRIFLPRLLSVPYNHWRLARMSGMSARDQLRFIEWPAIKPMILPMMVLVFLFCFSSFSLVLMLGGGPSVTTLEVEIYAAIRIAYDFRLAVALTLIQIAVALIMLIFMASHPILRNAMPQSVTGMRSPSIHISPPRSNMLLISDIILILMLLVLLVLPILTLLTKGVSGDLIGVLSASSTWKALTNSLYIALISALSVSILVMILSETRYRLDLIKHKTGWEHIVTFLLESGVMITLVIPSIVMGTAMFIMFRPVADIFVIAPFLVLASNILIGLPVSYRLISGKWMLARKQDQHLRIAYGIDRITSLRFLILPVMGRDIGLIFGMVAAMSMGDLGVIALFSSSDFKTLPWQLYQQAGRYRTGEAAATAIILMILTIIVFMIGHAIGRILSHSPSLIKTYDETGKPSC